MTLAMATYSTSPTKGAQKIKEFYRSLVLFRMLFCAISTPISIHRGIKPLTTSTVCLGQHLPSFRMRLGHPWYHMGCHPKDLETLKQPLSAL